MRTRTKILLASGALVLFVGTGLIGAFGLVRLASAAPSALAALQARSARTVSGAAGDVPSAQAQGATGADTANPPAVVGAADDGHGLDDNGALQHLAGDLVPSPGALVTGVVKDSPLDKAGVERGDVILSIDGKSVNTLRDVQAAVLEAGSGSSVLLKVQHGDVERDVTVSLPDNTNAPVLGLQGCGWPGVMNHVRVPALEPGVSVIDGGPAAAAGVQDGDEITAVDGQAVDAQHSLAALVAAHAVGDKVALKVHRGDADLNIDVTLGERPDDASKAFLGVNVVPMAVPRIAPAAPGSSDSPGQPDVVPMPFGQMPGGSGMWFGGASLPDGVDQGAVVMRVTDGGAAATAGLQKGDVITQVGEQPIDSADALKTAIAAKAAGDTVDLTVVNSDGETRTVTATLGDQDGHGLLGLEYGWFQRATGPDGQPGSQMFQFQVPGGVFGGQNAAPNRLQKRSDPEL